MQQMELCAIGNSLILKESALIEASNLKVCISYVDRESCKYLTAQEPPYLNNETF